MYEMVNSSIGAGGCLLMIKILTISYIYVNATLARFMIAVLEMHHRDQKKTMTTVSYGTSCVEKIAQDKPDDHMCFY